MIQKTMLRKNPRTYVVPRAEAMAIGALMAGSLISSAICAVAS